MKLPIMLPDWEADEYDRDSLIKPQIIEVLRTAVANTLKSSLPGYREGEKVFFYPEDIPERIKVGVSFSLTPAEDRVLVELELFNDDKFVGNTKVSVPLPPLEKPFMVGLYRAFPTEPIEREMANLLNLMYGREVKVEEEEDCGLEP